MTFAAIKAQGVAVFLVQFRDELVGTPMRRYRLGRRDTEGWRQSPHPLDTCDPGSGGARCAQAHPGADLEADFQPGSYGYRPKRTAHEAVDRVAKQLFSTRHASSTSICAAILTTSGMTGCWPRWYGGWMTQT